MKQMSLRCSLCSIAELDGPCWIYSPSIKIGGTVIPKTRGEVLDRVSKNLEHIAAARSDQGPFEVTQLIGSFLIALLQTHDELVDTWPDAEAPGGDWPEIEVSDNNQVPRDYLKKLRDALAHGNLVFEGREGEDIGAVRVWTIPPYKGYVDWDARLTIQDLEALLAKIIMHVQTANLPARRARRVDDGL